MKTVENQTLKNGAWNVAVYVLFPVCVAPTHVNAIPTTMGIPSNILRDDREDFGRTTRSFLSLLSSSMVSFGDGEDPVTVTAVSCTSSEARGELRSWKNFQSFMQTYCIW